MNTTTISHHAVMTPNHLAELISLSLTIPTLLFAFLVIRYWAPAAIKHLNEYYKDDANEMSEIGLLVVGVTIAFIGSFFDNLYWGIAWYARFLELPITTKLQADGVFTNIPFRQITGIIAGYCHVKAALIAHHKTQRLIATTAWILTAMTFIGLVISFYRV